MTKQYFTKREAKDMILDTLRDNPNIDPEQIFESTFNQDYYIIGTKKAEDALYNSQWGVFGAIAAITDYENEELGGVFTDLTNPEKIANMLEYMVGQDVWNELAEAFEDETDIDLYDLYGDELDTETQDKLINFIDNYEIEEDYSANSYLV